MRRNTSVTTFGTTCSLLILSAWNISIVSTYTFPAKLIVEPPSAQAWFPTKIQQTVDYVTAVPRLYLRHIVTETPEMAEASVQQYFQLLDKDHLDPFAAVAAQISACETTRNEGGKIGWVEQETSAKTVELTTILPADVNRQVFQKQPKAGDIVTIQSTSSQQYHVIQVLELWLASPIQETTDSRQNDTAEHRVGAHQGRNVILPRRKLKGSGVLPEMPHLQSYYIQTAGCQMNVADSERLAGVLQNELQLKLAETPDQADLVLFNTCSIRDHAEQKLYDALGPYAAQKRRGKQLALVVTGCVAQQEGEALLRRVPEIDVVLGPQYVPFLKNVLEAVSYGSQVVATAPMLIQDSSQQHPTAKPIRGHDVRAWVNVIYGCNEHCTYCVVPATRGMEQSRSMESILQECLELSENGYKEITLLGQNIDAYGRDMVPKRTFADLLEFLNHRLAAPMRLRYVTSHPRYFSDRVIDAVASLDKVCECFHMPFQAGDDEVLRRMRRGYTFDSYTRIIDKIRAKCPDAAITADVIVGFPGETDEAFQKTLELMEYVKFDNLNSFAYSPRPNTEAALWSNDLVAESVQADRLQQVQALAARHAQERSLRYLGRIVSVLVEDVNPKQVQSQVMGRTRQGRPVYFDGTLSKLRGMLVDVEITEARTWSLVGRMVSLSSTDYL